jgi:glycosyltransferase involved in cell wall biosynthesis
MSFIAGVWSSVKICLYAPNFPPKGDRFEGGLTKAVHGLASAFVQNGADVTVLCSGRHDSVVATDHGYEIRCFKRDAIQRFGLGASAELSRYIASCEKTTVFMLNGVFSPDVYAVSRACARRGLRYYSWPHDPFIKELFAQKPYAKWPHWYLRDRPMLQGAMGIQVFDEKHARLLSDRGVNTPTLEIDNGFDPVDAISESELMWAEGDSPSLIYLGRIDYYNKALDVLIDAFADLVNESDAHLTIQGPDNGDLAMIKSRAEGLGLKNDRLHFNAPQFDRTASQILVEHDVFMLPSRFEGFALAALEAMVAGRVLMVSEINGIAKHVEVAGCGVIVKPEKESVLDGYRRLIAMRPRWKEMGLAGREYALTHFRWERIARELIAWYEHG